MTATGGRRTAAWASLGGHGVDRLLPAVGEGRARGRAARPGPGPPSTESRSEPAASGVPSFGVQQPAAPEGITRARADDSPERGGGALGEVARPGDVEPRGEGVHQVQPVGQPGQEAVDGAHRQLVLGQLDHQGEDPVGPGGAGRRLRRGRWRRWPAGGGRRPRRPGPRPPRRPPRRPPAGSSSTQSSWRTPSSSVAAASGRRRRCRPAAVSPEARERPQIGERLTRVAASRSSRSLFALGSVSSWGRSRRRWPARCRAHRARRW